MSAKGCCYDNACAESFFHTLKVECIHGERLISRDDMRTVVFNYIECDYNLWRRHTVAASARNNLKIRISLRRVSILRGEDQLTWWKKAKAAVDLYMYIVKGKRSHGKS